MNMDSVLVNSSDLQRRIEELCNDQENLRKNIDQFFLVMMGVIIYRKYTELALHFQGRGILVNRVYPNQLFIKIILSKVYAVCQSVTMLVNPSGSQMEFIKF